MKKIKKHLHPYPFSLWISPISPKGSPYGIDFYIEGNANLFENCIIVEDWEITARRELREKAVEKAEKTIAKLIRNWADFNAELYGGGGSCVRSWKIKNGELSVLNDFL